MVIRGRRTTADQINLVAFVARPTPVVSNTSRSALASGRAGQPTATSAGAIAADSQINLIDITCLPEAAAEPTPAIGDRGRSAWSRSGRWRSPRPTARSRRRPRRCRRGDERLASTCRPDANRCRTAPGARDVTRRHRRRGDGLPRRQGRRYHQEQHSATAPAGEHRAEPAPGLKASRQYRRGGRPAHRRRRRCRAPRSTCSKAAQVTATGRRQRSALLNSRR